MTKRSTSPGSAFLPSRYEGLRTAGYGLLAIRPGHAEAGQGLAFVLAGDSNIAASMKAVVESLHLGVSLSQLLVTWRAELPVKPNLVIAAPQGIENALLIRATTEAIAAAARCQTVDELDGLLSSRAESEVLAIVATDQEVSPASHFPWRSISELSFAGEDGNPDERFLVDPISGSLIPVEAEPRETMSPAM